MVNIRESIREKRTERKAKEGREGRKEGNGPVATAAGEDVDRAQC